MAESDRTRVTPEAILAHLDGDESPAVAAYLRESPEGAALAADYGALQDDLARALYRRDCPTTLRLGDYALGMLPPVERTATAAHVADCPHCTGELAQIRRFLAIEADPPPLSLGERARRILSAAFAPPPAVAHAALRGPGDADARTYQADDITITLDPVAAAPRGRATLAGLIVRERDEPLGDGPVTLTDAAGSAQSTALDEFGNFLFEAIEPGDYRLEVVLGDDTVIIDALRVGR